MNKDVLNTKLDKLFNLYYDKAATEGEKQAAAIAIRKIQDRLKAIETYQFMELSK